MLRYSVVWETSDTYHNYEHTHFYFLLEGRRQVRGLAAMALDGVIPHVQVVSHQDHHNAIIGYHQKAPVKLTRHNMEEMNEKQANGIMWDHIRDLCRQGKKKEIEKNHFAIYCRFKTSIDKMCDEGVRDVERLVPIAACNACLCWGPSSTGKTTFARNWLIEETGALPYRAKCTSKWFCNYQGQKGILVDELSRNIEPGWFSLWKQIIDVDPVQVEVKGGHVTIRPTHVAFTSNYSPSQIFGMEEPFFMARLTSLDFHAVKPMTRPVHKPSMDNLKAKFARLVAGELDQPALPFKPSKDDESDEEGDGKEEKKAAQIEEID